MSVGNLRRQGRVIEKNITLAAHWDAEVLTYQQGS